MRLPLVMIGILVASLAGAEGLRDPTRPPQPRAAARAVVRNQMPAVSAIFTRGTDRKAIVDGRLVKAGDAIGGGRIEAVSADGIRWVRKGIAHELRMNAAAANFKKPAAGAPRVANGVP